jgi:hypothetical protein
VVSGQLNTFAPWELSCVERIPNRGFFVTEFTGVSDAVPTPQISQVGNTLIASPEFTGTIQWLLNNEPIAGANGQSYEPEENGSYSVIYTNEIGCTGSDTSSVQVVTTTGLEGTTAPASSLEAWPNPTEGHLFLRGLPATGTVQLTLLDAMGRTVAVQSAVGPNAHIDTMPLQPGVYWLRVWNGSVQQVLRFVKR